MKKENGNNSIMDFLKTFLSNNAIGILALVVTPLLAWWFNRPKQLSEVKKTEAEATSVLASSSGTLATSWENFAEQMQKQYNECNEKTNQLQEQISQYKTTTEQYKATTEQYKATTEQLDKKVNIITGSNNELESKLNDVTIKNNHLEQEVNTFKIENNKLKIYTQKLVGFIETLLDQIERNDPAKAQENIKELEIIKIQFKES